MASFVLASKSPRRRELLASAGLVPIVRAPAIDETPWPDEAPVAHVLRVATAKACALADEPRPVLAADTVVAIDAEILGKPASADDARRMLARLSNRSHVVHTAVALRTFDSTRGARIATDVVSTSVRFRVLSEDDIDRYVATGEPFDKAGAYGIQGEGGALVADVRGSYTNVVGLPLEETLALLRMAGLR